jgi:hypothetical protein
MHVKVEGTEHELTTTPRFRAGDHTAWVFTLELSKTILAEATVQAGQYLKMVRVFVKMM